MATKDISDLKVIQAYRTRAADRSRSICEILHAETGEPEKVCFRAMERAYGRGLIDCGVSLNAAWITEKGDELLRLEGF